MTRMIVPMIVLACLALVDCFDDALHLEIEEHLPIVEFWGLPPLIPLLQYVNRFGFEICSANSCQSEQGSLDMVI